MNKRCNGGVVLPQKHGSIAMALFTSEDKARRFRAANVDQKIYGPSVKFDWDHELLLYLEALPPTLKYIGVDPEGIGDDVLVIPVSELKAEIRRRLDEEE
jgi:hypothetical protein